MELPRLTPADSAHIIHGVNHEHDPAPLIELALDQSLPRDIRKTAGERLNDVRGAALGYIRCCNDKTLLAKLTRSGFVANDMLTFAKARLQTLTARPSEPDMQLALVAAMEEQNRLLRQLAGRRD